MVDQRERLDGESGRDVTVVDLDQVVAVFASPSSARFDDPQ